MYGTLEVNALEFKGSPSEDFMLIATYKNKDGIFEPDKIQISEQTGTVDGDNMIFHLPVVEGKTTSYVVGVSGIDKKVIVTTVDIYTDQKDRELARIEREENDQRRQREMQNAIKERRLAMDARRAQELTESQGRVRQGRVAERQEKSRGAQLSAGEGN